MLVLLPQRINKLVACLDVPGLAVLVADRYDVYAFARLVWVDVKSRFLEVTPTAAALVDCQDTLWLWVDEPKPGRCRFLASL
jgi:hypothetical protein